MEIHMGRLLERVVRKKGLNITQLARAIGVNRRSLYVWFEAPEIKGEIMERIAEAINHDFSNELPKSKLKSPELIVPDIVIKDDEYWKNKYIDLLERYSELLSKQAD